MAPAVFKTDVAEDLGQAGSIPVRLRRAIYLHKRGYRVSRWMGHSTIAITADLYTHLFEADDNALASRLEAAFLTGHTPDRTVVSLPTATG